MATIIDKIYKLVSCLADHYGFDADGAMDLVEENTTELAKTTSAHTMLISAIQSQVEKEEKCDIWKNSPYKFVATLESNNVGNVGETLIQNICKEAGIPAECDGSKTKKIGGGSGDGNIMRKTIEVKTARQGSGSPTFQHELGEVPWKADVMIFVDITPECYYLTIFKNFDESTYKSGEKLSRIFTTKQVTWRKTVGAFKLDTSVQINTKNISDGNTIKIDSTTPIDTIASFILTRVSF